MREGPKGLVCRCPLCGAEIAIISYRMGEFKPRCCNTDMIPQRRKLTFYRCEVCATEIAVLGEESSTFEPICCNTAMVREVA